jgi:hypothetical protein
MDAPSPGDLALVEQQLGRPPRDVLAIAARTADGAPAVVATAPRLADGTPFPTFYYLTHPVLVAAMSRLEAEGRMRDLTERLERDDALAEAYRTAHASYLADRDAALVVPELAGVSAGGMPTRVKCLHALAGHALAAGPGINPVGDLALAEAAEADPRVAALVPAWAAAPDGGAEGLG